jgi:subtilisin-like proprotein convertase family protein/uncharacterized protein YvpB
MSLLICLLLAGNGAARAETGEPPGELRPEAPLSVFLPFLERATFPPAGEPEQALFCRAPGLAIPDNQYPGVSDSFAVSDSRYIWDLDVFLDINHEWSGDIVVELSHLESGKTLTLMHRPGEPARRDGCNKPNIYTILDDELALPVENECLTAPPLTRSGRMIAISGGFTPDLPLNLFDGDNLSGAWQLTVSDNDPFNTGELGSWCLLATVNNVPAENLPPPPLPELPASAAVQGVHGQNQKYHLDCESRVAVDWAAFFGFQIGEDQFFNRLRSSDNPDRGFVGYVDGNWGQIPPHDYGVHAEPVVEVLREFGVQAFAHRPLSWEALRAEIAAGRPAYVWVVGSGTEDTSPYSYVRSGMPILYTSSDGHTSIVAHYEHTVMVIGYDPSYVTISDGARVYTVPVNRFLRSWSALGNMAITATP